MPYVDHRLAGFVSALPDTLRVRRLTTKWILRQAARQILPRRLRRRDGAPRRAPLGEWMRAAWRDLLIDRLHSRTSHVRAYLNAPVLDRVLEEHLKGRQDHQQLLWMLLSLETWHRTYHPG
jgi:asparagine synthase (glutamine-hydrolysing)